jgi:hypothetical protein
MDFLIWVIQLAFHCDALLGIGSRTSKPFGSVADTLTNVVIIVQVHVVTLIVKLKS